MDTSSLLDIVSGKRRGFLPGAMRLGLSCLTPIYRTAIWWRNSRFERGKKSIHRAAVPIISVGNITTGGTGKTPMVIWVCRLLQRNQVLPGIVSRGYRAPSGAGSKNDEALELECRLPDTAHVQDVDRVSAAAKIVDSFGASVIVLDDGFQHRRLGRDLDIVLIDASNPFGYGRLLPRGLLREPIESLRRADAIVVTRSERVSKDRVNQLCRQVRSVSSAQVCVSRTEYGSLKQFSGDEIAVDKLNQEKWFAFSAIGNPAAFEDSLRENGVNLKSSTRFRDHHWFTDDDRLEIARLARESDADFLVCTHKDLVKIASDDIDGLPVYALMIDLSIVEGRQQLEKLILRAASPKSRHRTTA